METERNWETLPGAALVLVFSKTSLTDRLMKIPLVCRSWNRVSQHPLCWESVFPESDPSLPPDPFVKDYFPPYDRLFVDPCFSTPFSNTTGICRLRSLIRRSDGRITSLHLFPFITGSNDDDVLRVIAESCPYLKHLSLEGADSATSEAMREVVRNCKKLELLDFSDSPCFSVEVLEELGSCCPDLHGIRRFDYSHACAIVARLGGLKFLNLTGSTLCDRGFSAIECGCSKLQYLDITRCHNLTYDLYTIRKANAQIYEFFYDRECGYEDNLEERYYLGCEDYEGRSFYQS